MTRLTASFYNVISGLPPFPGKVRLANALGKMGSKLGDGHTSVCVGPRARLDLDLSDRVQRQMWAGCYEPHVRKCLETLLAEGDVFLDVGAHIGYVSAIAASVVGPQGKVFVFEADPVLYSKLTRNLKQLPWVQAFHCAVWSKTCTLVFERSPSEGESGWGSLTSVRDHGRGECVQVNALSIDDWAARFGVARIRAIKVDAEGSEADIFQGARQTIARFRPTLVVEMNDVLLRGAGVSADELASRLIRESYTLFGLTWMRLEPFRDTSPSLASEILCIPRERAAIELGALKRAGFRLC